MPQRAIRRSSRGPSVSSAASRTRTRPSDGEQRPCSVKLWIQLERVAMPLRSGTLTSVSAETSFVTSPDAPASSASYNSASRPGHDVRTRLRDRSPQRRGVARTTPQRSSPHRRPRHVHASDAVTRRGDTAASLRSVAMTAMRGSCEATPRGRMRGHRATATVRMGGRPEVSLVVGRGQDRGP
jgi:hypothetical protein